MKLQIERHYMDVLLKEFPALDMLKEYLRFGNRAEVTLDPTATHPTN